MMQQSTVSTSALIINHCKPPPVIQPDPSVPDTELRLRQNSLSLMLSESHAGLNNEILNASKIRFLPEMEADNMAEMESV